MTEKKKPRTRKLERDRARAPRSEEKKSSTRHEAAKKAAKDKRKKAAAKAAPKSARTGRAAAQEDAATKPVKHGARKAAATPSRTGAGERTRSPRGQARQTSGGAPTRAERTERTSRPARSSARPSRSVDDGDRRPTRRTADSTATRSTTGRSATARPAGRPTVRPVGRNDQPERKSERRHVEAQHARRSPKPDRTERAERTERLQRAERTERPRRTPAVTPATRTSAPKVATAEPLDEAGIVATAAWRDMGVAEQFLPVLRRLRITQPFPIQSLTLPDALAGRDVLGRAQTGSGKTLAFGLGMLSRLAGRTAEPHRPLGLVMVPTRELAMQVTDALLPFAQSVGLDIRLIAGGMPYVKQIDALRRSVPVLVATPGRLNDLIAQGFVDLSGVEVTVLDEADQMCDMGFAPQIIEALDLTTAGSQRLLFSATLDGDVDAIVKRYLANPVEHATAPAASHVSTMEHFLFVVYSEDKPKIMAQIASRAGKTILFGRTQLGVERMAGELAREGVASGALHGGKTQAARTRTLNEFKEGVTHVLVATDVAARGIHVDGVSLVVHVDPPRDPKDYVHRAGRTARAGSEGAVVTLVGPRQQKSVMAMMSRAGVNPEVVRIKPMGNELVRITGARQPSGIPWHPPAQPAKRGRGKRGAPAPRRSGPSRGRPTGSRNSGKVGARSASDA